MFDAAAYLARIGLTDAPPPTADGLAALQRAHRLAIPFENLDIILGRNIAIDGASVFAKLVTARRGGYCFEHDRLFRDALAALGFTVRPLLARVWIGATEVPPLTHTLSLVTIDGQDWLADAGFGMGYTPPMPLTVGATATAPDAARFRIDHDPVHGWLLLRAPGGTGDFQRQYGVTLAPAYDADLRMSNHWTSTSPTTRYRRDRIVSIVLPRGFASLTDREYRRLLGDETTTAEIVDPRVYRLRLSIMFGIDLSADEVAALGLF